VTSLLVVLLGCTSLSGSSGSLEETDGEDTASSEATAADSAADSADTARRDTAPPSEEDDARVVSHDLPTRMACGEEVNAEVSMHNTGWATWSRESAHKLGAVDDSDPFHSHGNRVQLPEGVEVPTGSTWTFELELVAPDDPGTWTTDWRMVHEAVRWFGESVAAEVEVACDDPDTGGPPALDLDQVTWLHTDVSSWSVTSDLSSVSVDGSSICMDYDKADTWPIYDYDGTDVVGNPWVFIWYDDRWYGATWEWLRPGQACKNRDSVAGDHIKQSPFVDIDWRPSSGEVLYFMVSGLARSSFRNVEERTQPLRVVWP